MNVHCVHCEGCVIAIHPAMILIQESLLTSILALDAFDKTSLCCFQTRALTYNTTSRGFGGGGFRGGDWRRGVRGVVFRPGRRRRAEEPDSNQRVTAIARAVRHFLSHLRVYMIRTRHGTAPHKRSRLAEPWKAPSAAAPPGLRQQPGLAHLVIHT